ncbi:MAG: hypothetical protein KDA57_06085 [Planctomycetales bacterium]|nr:hypothetical protein [Planctomycetales bacterium]
MLSDGCGTVWRCALLGALAAAVTAVGRCEGQTVQRLLLPTFYGFGAQTTVVVPDRGTVYLGGVDGSRRGQNCCGMPLGGGVPGLGSRERGRNSSTGSAAVSATVIDHRELDRAVLSETERRQHARRDVRGEQVETAASSIRNTASQVGNKYVWLGMQAERDGDLQAARVFYEMAAERGVALQNYRSGRVDYEK